MSKPCDFDNCIFADKAQCWGSAKYCSILARKSEPDEADSSAAHLESTCSACGGPNITWTTDSELWNKYNGSPNGILCPVCFVRMAEKQGFDKCWRLIPV